MVFLMRSNQYQIIICVTYWVQIVWKWQRNIYRMTTTNHRYLIHALLEARGKLLLFLKMNSNWSNDRKVSGQFSCFIIFQLNVWRLFKRYVTHTHATTIITIESLVCFGRIQTEAIHSCDRIGVDGVSGEVLIV